MFELLNIELYLGSIMKVCKTEE